MQSGGTPETRNGLLEVQKAFRDAGLDFASQGVAITQDGSLLDNTAKLEKWIARFPMFDWVGGRTSQLSPVGLLPAALQVKPPPELSEWQNGRMEEWKNGRMEEWQNGRMAEWQNGRLAEWQNVDVACLGGGAGGGHYCVAQGCSSHG